MTHNGGPLELNDVLQVGRDGATGVFEANAGFHDPQYGDRHPDRGDPASNGAGTASWPPVFTNLVKRLPEGQQRRPGHARRGRCNSR
jgi:hypothetical protein